MTSLQYPCPACGVDAVYVKILDRYLHADGSNSERCWSMAMGGYAPYRPERGLNWFDAREMRCPSCGAQPGHDCVGRRKLHAPRVDRSIRLNRLVHQFTYPY